MLTLSVIQQEHVYHAWHLFWVLLNFFTLKKMFDSRPFPERFSQLVEILFPPPPSGSIMPPKIPFSIRDLLNGGFTIEPTDSVVEHLTLVNKTVKILA